MAAKITDKELIELGQKMQDLLEMGYINKPKIFGYTFLKGIAQGFGIFIGGSVVVAALIAILGTFEKAPLVQSLVEAMKRSF